METLYVDMYGTQLCVLHIYCRKKPQHQIYQLYQQGNALQWFSPMLSKVLKMNIFRV